MTQMVTWLHAFGQDSMVVEAHGTREMLFALQWTGGREREIQKGVSHHAPYGSL